VGHVVLQVLSWHQETLQEKQAVHFGVATGPWGKLTIQIWRVTYYGYFPMRFKNEKAISYVRQNRKGIGLPIRS
jgi:hypothetical protein